MAAPVLNSAIITNTIGDGLEIAEVLIPDGFYDWDVQTAPGLRWTPVPGGANPAGTMFQWVDFPWLELDGPGIVHHDHALPGTPASRWSIPAMYGPAMWREHHGLYGPHQILWLSHGANAPDDLATYISWYTAAIALFRAVHPNGPVVLDTVYPSSTSGADPVYRQAIFDVAAAIPGVLVLDTYTVRTFAEAQANGWIDDGVHYNPAGKDAYAADVGDLVLAAATAGEPTMIHATPTRSAIATAVKTAIDAGSGAGLLRIREGTTVLATITLGDPCGTVTDGVLTFSGFPRYDMDPDAGAPDNALLLDSDGTLVASLTVGVADADVVLDEATIAAGLPLKIASASYTAPV
jgi:hypothetical protein